MSVLQARRRSALSHNRWRSSEDCERQCRSSNNDEYCKLKCSRDMKLIRNGNNNNSDVNISLSEMSTSDSNLIAGTNGDEFLDTEESVHGLYFADPASKLVPSGSKTKESSNLITNSNVKSMADQKRELKDKQDVTTTIRSIEITTARRKTRPTVYRGRQKYVPVIAEKSVEESESVPYLVKIPTTSIRIPDTRNQIFNGRRTPTSHTSLPPRTITRSKEEELEILEVSVPRQSSTEKNKFWKTRNAATLNSYMRRLNPHLHSNSGSTIITTKRPETQPTIATTTTTTTTTTTFHYEVHRQRVNQTETPIAAINNLAEGPSDTKSVFLRSTPNASLLFPVKPFVPKVPKFVPENKNYYRPSGGLPSLIINIPEDATPYLENNPIFDEPDYPSTEPTTETIEIDFTLISNHKPSSIIVPDNPEEASSERKEEKTFSKIPDINDIFKNVSTTTPVTTVKDTIIPSSVSSSTTTSISKSTLPTTTEIFIPIKTTKRIYTTLPRRRPERPTTTLTPDQNGTTISSVLNNTSSKRNLIDETTIRFVAPTTTPRYSTRKPLTMIFTRSSTTSTTTKSSVIKNSPVDIEIVAPPSVTPEDFIVSSTHPNVILQGVSTTSKNQNTDVIVEMHKMNMATYVMAALGMVPLIVIVIYVIKQFIYRHERKDGDCEHYGNDIQPISPVVTLDHSDDGSIDGEDSIITETDFDRANLRFKSLLGEGNFGQVWKAEADDLAGHLGSTRIVAVKTERVNNGQGGLKAECEIMRKLGSHSNVVTLLGACVEQEPHLLIMEFAMRGRLLSLLRAARGVLNGLQHPPTRQAVMPLSPRRLTGFAHDIARGMEYISEKKIVHRDLAARNVLLDHNGVCKICDFGMSMDLDKVKASEGQLKIPRVPTYQNKFKFDMTARVFGGLKHYTNAKNRNRNCDTKSRPALPIRWMAPEALQYHIYSVETDCFAFGIVLWEIATLGITPYPTLTGREVLRGVPNGVRPEIPSDCRQELYDTMTNCWHKDPRQRPTMTNVRKNLARTLVKWQEEPVTSHPEYLDVSGFSEDYENGMIYFNRRVSEFECEI
ncbi:unnamed protein product [Diamesa serratosioi]